jgi:uncharacterized protein
MAAATAGALMPRTSALATSQAEFRFYEELNDFLAPALRKHAFTYAFNGTPSIKDAIEAIGVPHAEVDLVLVDGESVDFSRRLAGGERVAVYPVFERLDISPVTRLRARPLRLTRFVLDVHLGKLARYLRLLGFDTRYQNDYDDDAIIDLARGESRIILTRDVGLLKHSAVTHGYWVRATVPRQQLAEIVGAFDLIGSARPFSRCIRCNGELQPVPKGSIADRLPPRVRAHFDEFVQCSLCDAVYWPGSHYDRMRKMIGELVAGLSPGTASAASPTAPDSSTQERAP